MDHKIPKSKGGKWTPENLQTLCEVCNGLKGAALTILLVLLLVGCSTPPRSEQPPQIYYDPITPIAAPLDPIPWTNRAPAWPLDLPPSGSTQRSDPFNP